MLNELDLKKEIEKQLEGCEFKEKGKTLNVENLKNLNLEIDKLHSTKETISFYGLIRLQLKEENGFPEDVYKYSGSACVKENITISIPEYISVSKRNSLG